MEASFPDSMVTLAGLCQQWRTGGSPGRPAVRPPWRGPWATLPVEVRGRISTFCDVETCKMLRLVSSGCCDLVQAFRRDIFVQRVADAHRYGLLAHWHGPVQQVLDAARVLRMGPDPQALVDEVRDADQRIAVSTKTLALMPRLEHLTAQSPTLLEEPSGDAEQWHSLGLPRSLKELRLDLSAMSHSELRRPPRYDLLYQCSEQFLPELQVLVMDGLGGRATGPAGLVVDDAGSASSSWRLFGPALRRLELKNTSINKVTWAALAASPKENVQALYLLHFENDDSMDANASGLAMLAQQPWPNLIDLRLRGRATTLFSSSWPKSHLRSLLLQTEDRDLPPKFPAWWRNHAWRALTQLTLNFHLAEASYLGVLGAGPVPLRELNLGVFPAGGQQEVLDHWQKLAPVLKNLVRFEVKAAQFAPATIDLIAPLLATKLKFFHLHETHPPDGLARPRRLHWGEAIVRQPWHALQRACVYVAIAPASAQQNDDAAVQHAFAVTPHVVNRDFKLRLWKPLAED